MTSQKHQKIEQNLIPNQKNKEPLRFDGFINRQSLLFSSWKAVTITIDTVINEAVLTIRRAKKEEIQETINVCKSKISHKCSTVDQQYCFGILTPSNKKYLFSGLNHQQTNQIYKILINQKTQYKSSIKQKSPNNIDKQKNAIKKQQRKDILQFQHCQLVIDNTDKMVSTNAQTPKKQSEISSNNQLGFDYPRIQEKEEIFTTVLQTYQPQPDQALQIPIKPTQIHFKQVLSVEEQSFLESDEGFKLQSNFNEGRFLTKLNKLIKYSLVLATSYSLEDLMESLFHMELWNQQIKNYQLVNRIDRGLYLVKIQLHKNSFFSLNRYCYMMVHSWKFGEDHFIVLRSQDKSYFNKRIGYSWIDMNIWARVRGMQDHRLKLMNICAQFQNETDFSIGNNLFMDLKVFQTFLRTSNKITRKTLQWQEQCKGQ